MFDFKSFHGDFIRSQHVNEKMFHRTYFSSGVIYHPQVYKIFHFICLIFDIIITYILLKRFRILHALAPMSSTVTPATQIVDSGDTATFNCTVQGNPIKMVEWFKDGKLLADEERIIYESATLLHINDVQRKDQGMYQCFIKDGEEEVQGTSQLLLGGKRVISVNFENVRRFDIPDLKYVVAP